MPININKTLSAVIAVLKDSAMLDDCEITEAYPNRKCSLRLEKSAIAVGVKEIVLSQPYIDSSEQSARACVFTDIFTPLSSTSQEAVDIFSRVCKALEGFNIMSVSSQGITVDETLSTYVLKASVTIEDELIFGGNENE